MSDSVTPWTVAHQASLSITNTRSLLKLMSIESVMPYNYSTLCHPLLLPSVFSSIRVFSMSQFFSSGSQRIGASASVLPRNMQDWFPLGVTGWISLQSKGLARVFCDTTVQKASILWHSAFFMAQLSHPYMTTGKPQLSLDKPLSAEMNEKQLQYSCHENPMNSMKKQKKKKKKPWLFQY